jgi:hypothetical protein
MAMHYARAYEQRANAMQQAFPGHGACPLTRPAPATATPTRPTLPVMTHKYRGCIVVLSINKSVEPNEEQKVLTSGFDQGFTVNTNNRVFRSI